jgi:hypothetical protein
MYTTTIKCGVPRVNSALLRGEGVKGPVSAMTTLQFGLL